MKRIRLELIGLFYKWVLLPFSLIIGIPFAAGMWVLSRFVTYEAFEWSKIPENAILYSTHLDVYATCWNPQFSHRRGKAFVIGFHGFTPYLWIPFHTIVGISWEVYSRFTLEKPSDQILNFLNNRRGERLFLMTDAQGPYGKVRSSLVKLSLHSDRPLVAFRHHISKYIILFQHRIPLPGSRLSVKFSQVMAPEEIKDCADPATLLQSRLDELAC